MPSNADATPKRHADRPVSGVAMARKSLLAFTALSLLTTIGPIPALANPERAHEAAVMRLSDDGEGAPIALTMRHGESLDRLLDRVGVPEGQGRAAQAALRDAAPHRLPRAGDRIGLNLARSATGAANLNAIFIETGDRSNLTLVARPDEAPSTTLGDKPSADSTRRTVRGTSGADFTTTLADIGVPIPVIDDIPANPGPGARFRIVYEAPHGADPRLPKGETVPATADGTVSFVGRRGNYGKLIRLQHNGSIATAYAHLKDFVHGLKPGAHVRQGQVIGYVGRSGLATGNHLYYEVYDNGQQIDPLGGAASTAQHLSDAELKRLRRALARNGATID